MLLARLRGCTHTRVHTAQSTSCIVSDPVRWVWRSTVLHVDSSMHTHPHKGPSRAAAASGGSQTAAATGYWTLAEPYTMEVEVKKSRFITSAWPVRTPAEALEHIAAASDPTASHNCWAFKVAGNARSNDDGEPSGTAGKPILGAIEGDGLDGVAVLVVRHFGGTKLGAGGLVRAYGGAARDCLRAAQKEYVKAQVQLTLDSPFDCLGSVYNTLAKYGATAGNEEYTDRGKVRLQLTADADAAEGIIHALADATSGKVKARLVEQQQE